MPAKKLKPIPKSAVRYTGISYPGYDTQDGDWFVDGVWIKAAEFEKIYELPPEPEPIPDPVVEVLPPVPEAPPPQEPAEVPVTPEPSPVVEEPQVLSIGPPALDVDQGPMSHNQETP